MFCRISYYIEKLFYTLCLENNTHKHILKDRCVWGDDYCDGSLAFPCARWTHLSYYNLGYNIQSLISVARITINISLRGIHVGNLKAPVKNLFLGAWTQESIPHVWDTKTSPELESRHSERRWEAERREYRWIGLGNMMLVGLWRAAAFNFHREGIERDAEMKQERICEGGEGFFRTAETLSLADWDEPLSTDIAIDGLVVYTDLSSMHVNFKVCTQHKVCTIWNLRRCTFKQESVDMLE